MPPPWLISSINVMSNDENLTASSPEPAQASAHTSVSRVVCMPAYAGAIGPHTDHGRLRGNASPLEIPRVTLQDNCALL